MTYSGKSVAFHTLGCKLNFSETSTIARAFYDNGFQKKSFDEVADVYVINTCSVTENADKECKQIVNKAMALNNQAFIAVIGCYAQLKPNEISNIPGVDVVLGATEKFKLLNYVHFAEKSKHAIVHNCEIEDADFFVSSYSLGDRTRSFLKVQDGCDYSCTFCTIPLARGKSRSDSIENVIANAEKIASQGVKEIVLTGVNIGDFGYSEAPQQNKRKSKPVNFLDLIKRLDDVNLIERFRISSIEPNLLSDDIIDFVANSKKFAPHFHIPLQSGSNKILKQMKRRYLRELYVERISKIKELMPHACIGVDVIVGFPGETESDFLETYKFLNELNISYLHVFTYSERANTPALQMTNVVAITERKRRNKMLRVLSAKKLRFFYESQLGQTRKVLFEKAEKSGIITGFSDNYIKVNAPMSEYISNTIYELKFNKIDAEGNVLVNESITVLK
ncbi:MAG: tRNA (N(6)-L-threonylcarbamoyladenosine(37)-C(2))-methylthiotransferase MtaB [Bacteroidetes bacterium]|nr:tRNA (N(6)-L-threonylcarbamoyladenosine(37)-C(2))-methylthiotransferase MtaB [Bacteroidota bacterium]